MGFLRHLIGAVGLTAMLGVSAPALAGEYRACRSLGQCVDILERHAPDAFDYDVLSGEFRRFGPRATDRLIRMVGGGDEKQARNAIDMLSLSQPEISSRQVDQLITNWPDEVNQIRLLPLIAGAQTPQASAVFRAALMSGHRPSVHTAYKALARQNETEAIRAVQDAVFALREDQIDAALALSGLIVELDRQDGGDRFKIYALGLAQDNKVNIIANIIGLKAASDIENLDLSAISHSQTVLRAFENFVVRDSNRFGGIWSQLPRLAAGHPEKWYSVGQRLAMENNALHVGPVFETAEKMGPEYVKPLVDEFLNPYTAFPNLMTAIRFAMKTDSSQYQETVLALTRQHPVTSVRLLPSVLQDKNLPENLKRVSPFIPEIRGLIVEENRRGKYCAIKAFDIEKRVAEVPYFDWHKLETRNNYLSQKHIASAWPQRDGWIVGFDKGEFGGGLAYISHDMSVFEWLIHDHNIKAIIPFSTSPGKFYSDRFWVVSENSSYFEERYIFQLKTDNENRHIQYLTQLPPTSRSYGLASDDGILLDYGDPFSAAYPEIAHPPLRLSPDGHLTRACE